MKLKVIFLIGVLCSSTAFAQSAAQTAADAKATVSEEELIAAAERMIAQEEERKDKSEAAPQGEDTLVGPVQVETKSESEIPAFKNTAAVKVVEAGSWQRVAMSAALVLIFAVGLFFGVQRYAKRKSVQSQKLRMDVISQHHFSPKRSLIVVRVAGEHLLIGATDHSINLIKSISLIDDEADGNLPQDFNNFLEDDFVEQAISGGSKRRAFNV